MRSEEKNPEPEIQDQSLRLSVLVQLENGTILRLQEDKNKLFSIALSQGFVHKKTFKQASSYGNLMFYPDPVLSDSAGLVVLIARFLITFKGVVECLISGPSLQRRKLRDLLKNDTSITGRTIEWGNAIVEPVDLSSFISVTPKKGILTLVEALYPLEAMRNKDVKTQCRRLLKELKPFE
ncbi:MAG: hypothetical protein ACYDBV_09125 [Nitrospiria bacterium]